MKMKRFVSILSCMLIILLVPSVAMAETWQGEDFTIEVPDDMYQIYSDTSIYDSVWEETGLDAHTTLDNISNMNTSVHLVSPDGLTNIIVRKAEDSYYESVFNFGEITNEERETVKSYLEPSVDSYNGLETEVSSELVEHSQIPFIKFDTVYTSEDGVYYDNIYMTIYNGKALYIEMYSENEFTEAQLDTLEQIAMSTKFDEFLPMPDYTLSQADIIKFVAFVVAIVALIVFLIVRSKRKTKKDKLQKKEMAERLTQYRKEHPDNTVTTEMRFANVTNCSDLAIKKFSQYNSYLKNLPSLIIGLALCVVLLVLSFILDSSSWVMKLIALAVVVYYIFKIATLSSTFEKVQRNVYSRGRSRVAKYIFYEDSFKVSGIQHTSVYPYFQITDVRKYKGYIYLYYGPENAYIVSETDFVSGESADFLKFITEKTKE